MEHKFKVGDQVNIRHDMSGANYTDRTILYIDSAVIVFSTRKNGKTNSKCFELFDVRLSPVRTEREIAIDQMHDDACILGNKAPFDCLYNAGYRKVIPLSLKDFEALYFGLYGEPEDLYNMLKDLNHIKNK